MASRVGFRYSIILRYCLEIMMNEKVEMKTCCGSTPSTMYKNVPWITEIWSTPLGELPVVSTKLTFADLLGAWKVRWGFARHSFLVDPGLYAFGMPDADSNVFVTANYKMSFDALRSALDGRSGWLLVLNTQGVNVWCAAGKKTFGTEELIRQIKATNLSQRLQNRTLILPQLGASGVASHLVKKATSFKVIYGPVRAIDLPAFLDANLQVPPEMRQVRFGLKERIVLAPIELVISVKYALFACALVLLLGLFFSPSLLITPWSSSTFQLAITLLGAWLAGAFITPVLLPYLPGRAFSQKGAEAALLVLFLLTGFGLAPPVLSLAFLATSLFSMAISSFLAMNFTGASTYTSPSGVRKEMKLAVPLQVMAMVVGVLLWIVSHIF